MRQRLGREERPAVDERPDLLGRDPAPLADRVGELLGDRGGQAFGCLPGGLGVTALGELLGRALELVPLRHLEVRADLVQGAPQEHALDRDPGQPQIARGLQPDLVEGGGEVVLDVSGRELAERVGPRDRHLARRGELADRAAQVLHRGQADTAAADPGHQCGDAAVQPGPAQAVEDVGQDGPVPGRQRRDRVGGPGFADALGEVEFEDERRGPLLAQLRQRRGDERVWHGSQPRCTARRRARSAPGWRAASSCRGRRDPRRWPGGERMTIRDGNGWVRCGLGHRHWGRFGAAGLLAYVAEGGPVLLQQRTWWSHHGGTWGLPGGARDSHETVLAAAEREAAEECGVRPGAVRPRAIFTDDHGGWSYTTVLAQAPGPFEVKSDYDETEDVEWVDPVKVTPAGPASRFCRALAPAARGAGAADDHRRRRERGRFAPGRLVEGPGRGGIPAARAAGAAGFGRGGGAAGRSRPGPGSGDGGQLSAIGRAAVLRMTWLPEIVLVVEGAARPAAAEDGAGDVRVVAAPGEGDDTIAELAARARPAARRHRGSRAAPAVHRGRSRDRRPWLAAGADLAG